MKSSPPHPSTWVPRRRWASQIAPLNDALRRRGVDQAELAFALGFSGVVVFALFHLMYILLQKHSGGELWGGAATATIITLAIALPYGRYLTRTSGGEKVGVDDGDEVATARAYAWARNHVLWRWTSIAGAWAFVMTTEEVQRGTGGEWGLYTGAMTLFAAVAVIGGLMVLSRTHRHAFLARFQTHASPSAADAELEPHGGGRPVASMMTPHFRDRAAAVAPMFVVFVLAALVLPSGWSPFRLGDIDRWMTVFTRWAGPAIVPRDTPFRRLGEALGRSARSGQPLGDGGAGSQSAELMGFILQVVIGVLIAAFVARYFIHRQRRMTLSKSAGYVPWGVGWAWRELVQVVVRLLRHIRTWFAKPRIVTDEEGVRQNVVPVDESVDLKDEATIERIYVEALVTIGRRGMVRKEAETPYEFLTRFESAMGPDPDGLKLLTDVYVRRRYEGVAPRPSMLTRARHAATNIARAVRTVLGRRLFRHRPEGENSGE